MKLKNERLIIIVIILLLNNIGFSQEYIPMAVSKFYYYSHLYDSDSESYDFGYIIGIGNDTLIGEKNYKIVSKHYASGGHYCQFPPCWSFDFPTKISSGKIVGYIRDESISKEVFFLPADSNFICGVNNLNEYSLFDFSVNVGDTLSECFNLVNGSSQPILGIVDSLGSIQYKDKNRFVIYTTADQSAGFLGEGVVRILGGLGFEFFGLFHKFDFPMVYFCEGTLEECNIETSSKNLYDNQFLKIYPNPSTNRIEIKSSNRINSYILCDLSGKKMSSGKYRSSIDISSLNAGLYFLKVFLDDEIVTKRVVKINQ